MSAVEHPPRFSQVCRRLGRFAADFILFRSFFSRFWWAFFVLTLGSAVVYIFILAHVWVDKLDQRTQRVHRGLAKEVAAGLNELLNPELLEQRLIAKLGEIENLSPVFDLYVYRTDDQRLISASGASNREVPLRPLQRFFEKAATDTAPLRLDSGILDGSGVERRRIFSAERVLVGGSPGYVIAVLGGRRLSEAGGRLRESLLMSLGSNLLTGALVVTSLLGTFVLFLVSRRLDAMTAVVTDFQRGDYSRRIGDHSSDELGIFARAFDDMAERIVQVMGKLRTQDELRRQLVAEVSHELRRPLATLQLSLETLLSLESLQAGDAEANTAAREQYVDQALGDSQRLARLITDLFQLSRLDASEMLPELELCAVEDIVEEVVFSFSPIAKRKGVTLRAAISVDLPEVMAEAELLECALANLVENALHYTAEGGVVTLALSPQGQGVLVEVKDNGSGIEVEDLPHIFQRFYRGKSGRPVGERGAGLGLSLVKRIVELHRGTVSVESAPGKGTTISFVLNFQ